MVDLTHVNIKVNSQQSPSVESFTERYTDNERCQLQYIDYFKVMAENINTLWKGYDL